MQKKSIFDPVTKIGRKARRLAGNPENLFIGLTLTAGLGFIGYMGVHDEMQKSARPEDARKLESLDRLVMDKEDGARVSIISENAISFTLDGPHVSFLFDLNDQFVIARGSSGDSTPVASSLEAFNNPGMVTRAVAMACKTAAQVDKLPPPKPWPTPTTRSISRR